MATLAAVTIATLGAGTAAQAAVPEAPTAPRAVPAAVPTPPSGFTTVWSDDFGGAAGSGLDRSQWLYDIGHGYDGGAWNWGTGEIEYMTDSTANVYQDGSGHLAIKPIRDAAGGWTSGRIETQDTSFAAPAGGVLRVEASIKQPDVTTADGAGYWPAFWMLGASARGTGAAGWPSLGEIDILENINGRSSHFAALHCGTNPGGPCNETTGLTSGERTCATCGTSFHTYGVEVDRSVSPEQIRYYRDGTNFFTVSADQVDATTWDNAVHHGFFIILNVAVGGGFPDAFGGGPYASTVSGRPMLVDYVTVATKTPGSTPTTGTGPVLSGIANKCLDVAGADSANGTAVQLWDCNGTVAQKWTLVDNSLRAMGKCLDATEWGTANRTPLQIWDCNPGQPNQVWEPYNGGYRNPASGRCIDDPGSSTANGARIQLWDCNGTNAQKWSLPGGAL
ncbi:ricin-type beta-trefoil lectin domain protein [Actinotalea sp. M2MS4P-6]|uniref:ricin-type beta-trefoil lectin domain protein n=1 Tax=Actinotalea sp. M2MS4P-6 TaxID=2983762 RepID=UPI0021E3A8F5|nr:ricin-type beta-trefoil lectin domain protein [Actinotalea sp. M2MS4P-6]MCV2395687.1 ricin-type beta-trefoil lectin domain protein [Actinotalea sp. M2MS4P-6]